MNIPWAPSDVEAENNTTRWGDNRPSILSNISHEAVYTQSAASGSDNHTCIPQHSYSTMNHYTYTLCCTNNHIEVCSAVTESSEPNSLEVFNLELDSHANMVVIGDQATIIQTAQQTADVRPFSNECSKLEQVPIVDAAFAYDCSHSGKAYMLVV